MLHQPRGPRGCLSGGRPDLISRRGPARRGPQPSATGQSAAHCRCRTRRSAARACARVARASLIRCVRPRGRVSASVRERRVTRARERGARHRRPPAHDARSRIVDKAYLPVWRQIITRNYSLPSSDSADRMTPTWVSRKPAVPAPHGERPRVRAVCCALLPSPSARRSVDRENAARDMLTSFGR